MKDRAIGGARRGGSRGGSTAGPPRKRATGPALEERRRGRLGFLLPEVVTVRTLVLSVLVLLAVVLLLPTLRAYVNQTGELRDLRAQLAAAEAEHDALQVELERWDDRNYVIKEARDHLNFVMPGDQPWRVLDPETVVDDTDPTTGQSLTAGPLQGYEEGTPWYEAIWDSVQLADQRPSDGTPASDDNG